METDFNWQFSAHFAPNSYYPATRHPAAARPAQIMMDSPPWVTDAWPPPRPASRSLLSLIDT